MSGWSNQMESHRANYVARCIERLVPMEAHIVQFARSPWDQENLKQLAEHFHQIAGSAGVYNLSELTPVAEAGERLCMTMFQEQPDDIIVYWRHFREMTTQMHSILASANLSATEGQAPPTHLLTATAAPLMVQEAGPDVIIVSSDRNRLAKLERSLSSQGMSVRPCPSWVEAKDAIMTKFPDGLLVCVPISDGNGYDLIAGCRSLPGGDGVSIVLLSEEQGFIDKIGAIKAGTDAFFELPTEVDVIVEKLRYLFERGKPERYRILSVEDDADQAKYLISIMEEAGYHVLWQQDPRLFEEALLTFCPDLLLLDIMMGEINGFELARFVRQNERFAAIPILFLTTQNQLEAHIESARAGGDDHLIKPVNPQLLISTIAGKLERYRIFQKLLKNDGLTQTLNHSHFMEFAKRSVKVRAHRFEQVLTIFDIDDLKLVNDNYGFAVGDRTIVSLVQIIKKVYRHTDIIGRIGGDEIAVLDDSLRIADAKEVSRELLGSFANVPHKSGGQFFKMTVSAGVASLQGDGDFSSLVERASLALKTAKQQGKNQVVLG
ncbi:MAG: diguanylate cyclase [Candidatus Obscuribacterales bacterium]|nr:diguanylate cyclase [Candidatus Obscuribacterales bacterium]